MVFIYIYASLFQKGYKVAHKDIFHRARKHNFKLGLIIFKLIRKIN